MKLKSGSPLGPLRGETRFFALRENLVSKRGQSLVEMAIITPLLLLMFIGVFEVGWALRGHMVILNASREAARFASRGRYIDFTDPLPGYASVITHTLDTLGYNLANPQALQEGDANVGLILASGGADDVNGAIFISHFLINTQAPITPPTGITGASYCDRFQTNPPNSGYTGDDTIQGPHTHLVTETYTFPSPPGYTSRIIPNAATLATKLKAENDYFNCILYTKDPQAPWSTNSVIVVEIFFDQPQLLGVPLISNYLTDPIPLYVNTQMRITGDARGSGR